LFAVFTCIFAEHDLRLVAVAALICVTACASAFGFQARSQLASGGLRGAWLVLTGMVAGSGVWATHFLAMLAYQPSLKIAYDLPETLASLVAAVVGMGLGFALLSWRSRKGMDLVGGALTGASIAVMHYMGMDAIRTAAEVQWDFRYVIASLAVTAIGGMAAFAISRQARGYRGWAASTVALVAGIVGLHFTGMTAVTLIPDPSVRLSGEIMGRGDLALLTGGLAALILAAGFALVLMERVGRRSTFASVRGALNAVPSSLAFYDEQDRLRVWNNAFEKLTRDSGSVPEVGGNRRDYIEAAARSGWFAVIDGESQAQVERMEQSVHGRQTEFHLPDGRWIRHEAHRTTDGGMVTVLTDITTEKQAAEAMAAARDAAEAANRAKSEFLANISHEIRTPLNGVLGIAEALQRSDLGDEQRKLVSVIQRSGGLLNGILGDILDLAKVEAGAFELRPERVTLGELVRGIRDLYTPAAQEKGLKLVAAIGADAEGDVECDPQRLAQVLGNLVSNAVKFTDFGEVAIAVERDGDFVRFAVRDTGIGFDEGERDQLLQRFRQADSSATRKHGGAGLGLALCEAYLRAMDSGLDCRSTVGRGSVFGFELGLPLLVQTAVAADDPATDESGHEIAAEDVVQAAAPPTDDVADEAIEDYANTPADPEEGVYDLARFNVLVVDDNPVNRQVLELILASVGIPYASVENGQEAVDAMLSGDFDAVLMDIQMPVMDGLEATRRIRQWERDQSRGHTPIVIVSANGLAEHVEAGRAAGADAHLNKPVSAADLLSELEHQRVAAAAAQRAA
jgi:signal transduction histidine kinase/NO-binding membrane sensor protein with MHYT domain/ActR/RegA family two-component response regulator